MTGGELKQLVVVLFLSGAVAADWPELQRIEKTGDAMGAMCGSLWWRRRTAASTVTRQKDPSRYRRSCSSCSRPAYQGGLGQYDLAKIDVVGARIADVQRRYMLHADVDRMLEWRGPMRDLPPNLGYNRPPRQEDLSAYA